MQIECSASDANRFIDRYAVGIDIDGYLKRYVISIICAAICSLQPSAWPEAYSSGDMLLANACKAAKRRRLQQLVGLKGITINALAALIATLHENPQKPVSANTLRRTVDQAYEQVAHVIKLPLLAGGSWDWHVCRIDKLLDFFANQNPIYRRFLGEALACTTDNCLNLILYCDEVTPGNALRPDNARKFWSFYIGFAEMPASTLYREQFWLPIGVLRTTFAGKVTAGISNCVRLLVRSILLDPCRAASVGFACKTGPGEGVPSLIRIRKIKVLADESALKFVFSNKGASGLRFCLLCRNVVSISSNLTDGQAYLVDASCSDPTLFHEATDESIWKTWDNLAAKQGTLTKTAFAELEKASGFTYHPDALLSDKRLRRYVTPASAYTMDWLHNFLANGTASVEITLFLGACKRQLGIAYEHLDKLVGADWAYPASRSQHKVDASFSAAADKHSDSGFRGTGSQVLMLYPVLRFLALKTVLPSKCLDDSCHSFLAMCDLLDVCLQVRAGSSSSAEMVASIQKHFEMHKTAYGNEYIKPKHHFAFHNALGKQEGDVWIDCFVHERKHQVVKQAASMVKNTSKYECSVLGRVLLEQQRQLESTALEDVLFDPSTTDEDISRLLGKPMTIAKRLQHKVLVIAVGDFVLHNHQIYCVKACMQDQSAEALYLLLQGCTITEKCASHSVCQLMEENLNLLLLDDSVILLHAYCWTKPQLGQVTVLHPSGVL